MVFVGESVDTLQPPVGRNNFIWDNLLLSLGHSLLRIASNAKVYGIASCDILPTE